MISTRRAGVALALMASWLATAAPASAQGRQVIQTNGVLLQGLDKITARVFPVETVVGQVIRFGTLEITVRTCQKTPPEEPPENGAFLEVVEVRPGQRPQLIFEGWMYSSSPAVSALEHPVYDVWVVECRNLAS